MGIRLDPEEIETAVLFDFAGNFTGKGVLEVGCGDGRLTRRYAEKAAFVRAIDPNGEKIALARQKTPPGWQQVEFHTSNLETFITQERFDLAILSWSL
jgi:2-polyprenyl-3-methyl-5-hydroxy-6-metoxy-1,4-benzoquinol methylase